VNDKLERLPDRYKVFVMDDEGQETKVTETLEFGSFQQALQAFINRLE
jgi:hypothetical protein